MARFWRSLSFRLALIYTGLLCLSMALLSASYYWIAISRPLSQLHTQINQEAQSLAQLYIVDGQAALITALEERAKHNVPRKAFHAFLSPHGKLITGNLPSWPQQPADGWLSIEADIYHDGDELDFNALSRDRVFRNGARLIVGRDAEDIKDRSQIVRTAMPWLLVLTILFGVTGGLLMSRAIGRRLDTISAAARQVIAGDLSGRVEMAGKGDDFDRLADTLNAMLARNQMLFEAIGRVSDNIAHELRTPLARLIARLETLESNSADPATVTQNTEAALDEAQRLQTIFRALLRIARIESGRHTISLRDVNLITLARDAVELYAPVAAERAIDLQLEATDALIVQADPDLLFQALANLLDNALKHTPSGGLIRIEANIQGSTPHLTITDTGTGLLPEEMSHITERFFRGKAAHGLPGEGLGLSLVAAIARFHHARLSFRHKAPGLQVELAFPPNP